MLFDKNAFTHDQHIKLLRERGLIIADEKRAIAYLNNISYYRLSAYMLMLVVIETLLRQINPDSQWRHRLKNLLDQHTDLPLEAMGLSVDWYQHPFWQMKGDA